MTLAPPPRSRHTEQIVERLAEVAPGSVVTYRALSAAVGFDVVEPRHYLTSALRILAREQKIEFEAQTNVGLRRLMVEDFPKVGRKGLTKIRRHARRTGRRLGNAGAYNDAPELIRLELSAQQATLGAIELFAKTSSVTKIKKAVEVRAVGAIPPPREVMSLFQPRRRKKETT